jgi:hypothetical protein
MNARRSLRNWHWREWEAHFGEIVSLEDSPCKAQAMFEQEHANDLLVVAAFGEWHRVVPKGMVGVIATLGRTRTPGVKEHCFLVPADEYETRQDNPGVTFVVDPSRHEAWDRTQELKS